MHGTMPDEADQLTLDVAGDAVDRKLEEVISRDFPEAQHTIQMIKEVKERFSYLGDPGQKIMVTMPVKGKPTEFDMTSQLKEACEILIDREDLTEGDLGVIEVYAANHQTFKECCRTLAAEGLIVENSRGSMSAHPAVTVRKQAETQLALAAMQLGFSPKSRRDMKVAAADSTPHQDKAVGSF
jgi:P27 family predicted phage terminase small subunit